MKPSLRRPVCFVLIPFGVKVHPDSGASVDFDAIYEGALRPALNNAGMDLVRMDQDVASLGPGYVKERVMGAEFALADVTTRDPAILLLLGARAERMPGTTLVTAARGSETQLASLSSIRVVAYELDEGNRLSSRESMRLRRVLSAALSEMRGLMTESEGGRPALNPDEQERSIRGVEIAQDIEFALNSRDIRWLKRLEADLTKEAPDSALLLNIFQAFGTLGDWEAMVHSFRVLPDGMQRLPRVRQQAALALNRLGKRDEALGILDGLLKVQGSDSETLGLLGRIYKDQWFETKDSGALDRAIESYMRGFEANRKDPYPGINAVTLLEIRGDPDSLRAKERLLPLVSAAVEDQIRYSKRPNYWDYATLLELAVIGGDETQARRHLGAARGCNPEGWQTETTANNLDLIRTARAQRNHEQPWLKEVLSELHTPIPITLADGRTINPAWLEKENQKSGRRP